MWIHFCCIFDFLYMWWSRFLIRTFCILGSNYCTCKALLELLSNPPIFKSLLLLLLLLLYRLYAKRHNLNLALMCLMVKRVCMCERECEHSRKTLTLVHTNSIYRVFKLIPTVTELILNINSSFKAQTGFKFWDKELSWARTDLLNHSIVYSEEPLI